MTFQWVTAVWSKKNPFCRNSRLRLWAKPLKGDFPVLSLLPRGGAPPNAKVGFRELSGIARILFFVNDLHGFPCGSQDSASPRFHQAAIGRPPAASKTWLSRAMMSATRCSRASRKGSEAMVRATASSRPPTPRLIWPSPTNSRAQPLGKIAHCRKVRC